MTTHTVPLPNKKYDVIYADPAWRYQFGYKKRAIENHYPTMLIEDIKNLDVKSIRNKNAVLYLWATAPKLAESLSVIESWGFVYKTNMVWVKDKIGMGYWCRNQHELLLIATYGNISPPEQSLRISSVFDCRRGRHSEKPLEIKHRITDMFPTQSKIELFARPLPMFKDTEDGWDYWGNEV